MANELTERQLNDFRGLHLFCEQTLYNDGPSAFQSFLEENEGWVPTYVDSTDEATCLLQEFTFILMGGFSVDLEQRLHKFRTLLSAYKSAEEYPQGSLMRTTINVGVSLWKMDWYLIEEDRRKKERMQLLERRQVEGMLLFLVQDIIEDPVFGDAHPEFGRELFQSFCMSNPDFVHPSRGLLEDDSATILFFAIVRAFRESTLETRLAAYESILDTYSDEEDYGRYATSFGFVTLMTVVHQFYLRERQVQFELPNPQPDPHFPHLHHLWVQFQTHPLLEIGHVYASPRDRALLLDTFVAYVYHFIDPQLACY